MKKYYISTAIAYTSGKPHIGNTYEVVMADAIARYKRLKGFDVYFQTGTDEHGQKIQKKAVEQNMNPQKFVDEISKEVKRIFDDMNTSYDKFVRTTDEIHTKKVQEIFEKLYKNGDIYKGKYEGLYCTPCESFFTDSQLIGEKCPDCGRVVEKTSEEAYFLKLSKYEKRLREHIEKNPDFLKPLSRKNEIINNFLEPGLQDLCISRTSFEWGIPVSFDNKHVIYVWVDALSNYITFLGYDINKNHSEKFKKYWPADVHLIGKDIFRFHAIYWVIILMALEEELPKQIFGHPWLLTNDSKMSKSKGNVLYADDLVKQFGLDEIRYYLLHEMPYSNDGIITYDLIIERINSDLANTIGNLVNRTISMNSKYFNSIKENPKKTDEIDKKLIAFAKKTISIFEEKMDEFKICDALETIMEFSRRCNKYIDETTPWILGKDENNFDRLKTILYNLLESIRIIGVLLQPFLPDTSKKIFEQINTSKIDFESIKEFGQLEENKTNEAKPLFIRIDREKKLLEISKKMI